MIRFREVSELPIKIAGKTDKGLVRDKNEDSFFAKTIRPKDRNPLGIRAVLVVADGMGGHVGGEKASSAAVRLIYELFKPKNNNFFNRFGGDVNRAIVTLIGIANSRVNAIGRGSQKPPGTTLTSAFIVDDRAYIGHVGDSRAYLIRNDEIVAITEDHSFVGKLIREGKLTHEDARDFPQKNILLKSLGAGDLEDIDEPYEVNLKDGDILLLCTDGLWDLVTNEEILGEVHREKRLKHACDNLVKLAKRRGGHDNITVVAAEYGNLWRDPALAGLIEDGEIQVSELKTSRSSIRKLIKSAIAVLSVILVLIIIWIFYELKKSGGDISSGSGTTMPSASGDTMGIQEDKLGREDLSGEGVNPKGTGGVFIHPEKTKAGGSSTSDNSTQVEKKGGD